MKTKRLCLGIVLAIGIIIILTFATLRVMQAMQKVSPLHPHLSVANGGSQVLAELLVAARSREETTKGMDAKSEFLASAMKLNHGFFTHPPSDVSRSELDVAFYFPFLTGDDGRPEPVVIGYTQRVERVRVRSRWFKKTVIRQGYRYVFISRTDQVFAIMMDDAMLRRIVGKHILETAEPDLYYLNDGSAFFYPVLQKTEAS